MPPPEPPAPFLEKLTRPRCCCRPSADRGGDRVDLRRARLAHRGGCRGRRGRIGHRGPVRRACPQGAWDSLRGAVITSCMIAFILVGAAFLTGAMGYTGTRAAWRPGSANRACRNMPCWAALLVFFIVLGFFLDGISIVVLTVSIILPMVLAAGIDPIWFGVFLVLVVEMSQITPPVGFNLFRAAIHHRKGDLHHRTLRRALLLPAGRGHRDPDRLSADRALAALDDVRTMTDRRPPPAPTSAPSSLRRIWPRARCPPCPRWNSR